MKRPPQNEASSRAGFTIIELMISMSILAILLGAVAMATIQGSNAFKTGVTVSQLESQVRRATDRIASELISAGAQWIVPPPSFPLGSAAINYQRNVGFNAGNIIWGGPMTITMQPDPNDAVDGVDNNSNGLIDEGQIVLITPTQTLVLTRWVRLMAENELANGLDDNGNGLQDEAGMSFVMSGNTLTIRVTLERLDPNGRLITRSAQTSVRVRN